MATGSAGEETIVLNGHTPIDTSQLVDFLPAMGAKWFDIGLKLDCKDLAMELMSSTEFPRNRCFLLINEWMNKRENACWEVLCRDILRSEGIGLGDVADRIEKKLNLESSRQVLAQMDGSVETKYCTCQVEIQELQLRVKELKDDNEQLAASKQQVVEKLTAKCSAEEEMRRRAEERLVEIDCTLRNVLCEKERLESELRQYRLSMEEQVRDLTVKRQQSVEINEDTTTKLALLTQQRLKEVEEIDRLKSENATLDKENEEYSEEMADMRHKMGEIEAKLERQQSMIQEMHGRARYSSDSKATIAHCVSSPSFISEEVITSEVASLEVKDVLQCQNEEARNHLKTFFVVIDTSSEHVTYTSGSPYRDWRCLAEHVGLHKADLQATNCERRLSVIFEEWAKKETVTVAKVRQLLTKVECIQAAECLVSAAQCVAGQEEDSVCVMDPEESMGMYAAEQEEEALLDLGDYGDQSC